MPDEPEKIDLNTPDLAAEKLAALEELFPGVVADGVVDAIRLAELVGLEAAGVKETRERYGLMWAGKNEAVQSLVRPIRGTLKPSLDESVDFNTAENVFIEGDNLEVLKLLQKSYNDSVNLIYIDPPYNTGNDFVYDDDFADGMRGYLEFTGQLDVDGNRTSANADTAGRRHSHWLSMIFPRLVLARNLLTQDGALFVSIDDNEAANLRAVLDEVFGAENFVAQMVWAAGRKNDSKFVSVSHEYILVYARNMNALKESVGKWRTRKEGLDEIYAQYEKLKVEHQDDATSIETDLKAWYTSLPEGAASKRHKHYSKVDERGVYFADNISWPGGGGPAYEVLHPVTGLPVTVPSRGWMFSTPERMQELIDDDRVHFGATEAAVPCIKAYLADRETEVPYSVFYVDGRGATKRLRELLGGAYFENPKDETVLQRLVEFASPEDGLVMDFFAGSGSMAHAVALQNLKDGGSRRCISVNLPEPTPDGSAAREAGLETVADITYRRIRAVMETVEGSQAQGLRKYSLTSSQFREAGVPEDGQLLTLDARTLVDDAPGKAAVASEVLVSQGVRLDAELRWEEAGGSPVAVAEGVAVVISHEVTEEVVDEAIALEPRILVFLEDGLAGRDAVKANAFYSCQQSGITMKTV